MKVLIVSHNPVSEQSNMGKTFLSLFSGFGAEELCQLYIYPTIPDQGACGSYYRVTDKDALASRLHRGPVGGEISGDRIGTVAGAFEHPGDAVLYRSRRNKSPLRQLLRDGIWQTARWYTPQLGQWLDREAPNCMFVAPGGAKFLYDMALRIARDRALPVVTYLCDEHYFVAQPHTLSGQWRLKLLKGRMEALLTRSAALTVISPELKAQYGPFFGLETTILMTGAAFPPAAAPKGGEEPEAICYFGNIRCGRWRSLARIAEELDDLNLERGTAWKLRIHTAEEDPEILSALKKYRSLEFGPFVTGSEFARALHSARLLLHVEDFAPESVDAVRHSVSTKIADSLASGVPLVAYGPPGIASMEHLRHNDCALLADDPAQLRALLMTAFTDAGARTAAAQKGLETAERYHSAPAVSRQLRAVLQAASQRKPRKILQINNFYGENSTGKLTQQLCLGLRGRGMESLCVYGRGKTVKAPGVTRLCPEWYAKANSLLAQLTGVPYGGCLLSTWRLQRILRREKPDVVHLQCINGNFVNIYRLLAWLKQNRIPTVVSLHAEFLYTGNCGHAFDCDQWRHGCRRCPDAKVANRSKFFDRTAESWRKMRQAFRDFDTAILCPVSRWTENRALQSDILKDLPMYTVRNGVNTAVFCPDGAEKENYILHVTAHFSPDPTHTKGGRYILELARRMPQVPFLVAGPGERIPDLPANVQLLGRITDQHRLADLYRRARVTVLTGRRETFSMPCAESLCCGTPVVGFLCGGTEEIALPAYSEFVPFGDLDALEGAVRRWMASAVDPAPLALKTYDAANMAEEFERIYEKHYEM